jgi:hypothetical protein
MWFTRYRHRKGFGIHSPFAFQAVGEVINLPAVYGYYHDDALSRRCRASSVPKSFRRMAVVAMRWVARHATEYACVTNSVTPLFKESITLADSRVKYLAAPPKNMAGLFVTAADDTSEAELTRLMNAPDAPVVVAVGYRDAAALCRGLNRPDGICFYSVNDILFIPYAKTRFVAYDILF